MADNKRFCQDALKAHNEYRSRHQVATLKQNKEITVIAQKWADHLASTGSFQHSQDRNFKGQKLGENIAMKWTSGGDEFTGQQVTNQWYSEVTKHNYSAASSSGSGHFSQVVWKGSQEYGIGRAKGRDGKWIVVGNYYPAGNLMGTFKQNVFPPKDGNTALIGGDAPGAAAGGAAKGKPFSSSFERRPEGVAPVARSDGGGGGGGRSVSTSTKTITEGSGANKVTKVIVTETVTDEHGNKSTTTRETVTKGEGAAGGMPEMENKFGSMGVGDDQQKPQNMDDFIEDVVKCHNKYRRMHGNVGDLKHNKELSTTAQRWADNLARAGSLSHSNATHRGEQLGENVASKFSSAGADYTGQQLVDQWYSEVSKYNFSNGGFSQGTGHFSQVVWKDSREVGLGKAFSGNNVFVVANYHPAGNVMGRFDRNVFPAK